MLPLTQRIDRERAAPLRLPVGIGATVCLAAFVGLAGGAALGFSGTAPLLDRSLDMLLRFMAVLKLAMATGVAVLTAWRLRQGAPAGLRWALLSAVGLMAAAPPLIFGLRHVIAGAVLFHGGLLTFLVAALRDGDGWKILWRSRARH